jgi:hypothetical protein
MFKIITSALDLKKTPELEEIQKIPSFIFCKWLSGNPYTIGAANLINMYFDIPVENQYFLIKKSFAGKVKYIPYPKAESENEEKMIGYISDFFKISIQKAKEYCELMDRTELNRIVKMYEEYESKK